MSPTSCRITTSRRRSDGARIKAGLDPQTVFEMSLGPGNSRVFELRAPMMVKDRYDNVT